MQVRPCRMRRLDVSRNPLGNAAGVAILRVLVNDFTQYLDMSYTELRGELAGRAIGGMLRYHTIALNHLNVEHNALGRDGVNEVRLILVFCWCFVCFVLVSCVLFYFVRLCLCVFSLFVFVCLNQARLFWFGLFVLFVKVAFVLRLIVLVCVCSVGSVLLFVLFVSFVLLLSYLLPGARYSVVPLLLMLVLSPSLHRLCQSPPPPANLHADLCPHPRYPPGFLGATSKRLITPPRLERQRRRTVLRNGGGQTSRLQHHLHPLRVIPQPNPALPRPRHQRPECRMRHNPYRFDPQKPVARQP